MIFNKKRDSINMAEDKKKSGLNLKALLIGIPLFVIQVAAVYYVTANILLSRFENQAKGQNVSSAQHGESSESSNDEYDNYSEANYDSSEEDDTEYEEPSGGKVLGEHIYSIDDIIVNPSGTDGKRLLLTSVGLDVSTEEQLQTLEKKEILVKDIIISVLASKRLDELKDYNNKDSLKVEISKEVRRMVKSVRVNKVYFSKYIIQ